MNKVFKVIWSEARNAYVVVSEMAKSHGTKSCSTKKLLAMLIATGVMTCASVAPAMAANLAPTETKIEIGEDASASGEGTVTITGVAKAEDVAVVYDQNKTSLRSTNASVAENAIALGKGASAVKNSEIRHFWWCGRRSCTFCASFRYIIFGGLLRQHLCLNL